MPVSTTTLSDESTMLCDTADMHSDIKLPPTPPSSHSSRSASPELATEAPAGDQHATASKKKKKKKSKKTSKAKATSDRPKQPSPGDEDRPSVLCISRNKHWRYISSYHVCNTLVRLLNPFDACPRGPGCNYLLNFWNLSWLSTLTRRHCRLPSPDFLLYRRRRHQVTAAME